MSAPSPIDLDRVARECYAAVISDCCDALGLRSQTLEHGIVPLAGDGVLAGFARPVRSEAVERAPERHYGREIDFIDSLQPGDVVMGACAPPVAFWGELFSAAARGRGARGAVVDGLVRDRARVGAVAGFVLHGRGTRPTDSLGRISIVEHDTPIVVGGVTVQRGDLVVADGDGVVVVPADVAPEVVERALAKAGAERSSFSMLLDGAYLREAWERHGVL
jgi:regulator of RNase E activity RraA